MILSVLFAARAAIGFQFQSIGSAANLLMADLGIGYSEVGMLLGAYMLPGVVVAFPAGMLGSRGREKMLGRGGARFAGTAHGLRHRQIGRNDVVAALGMPVAPAHGCCGGGEKRLDLVHAASGCCGAWLALLLQFASVRHDLTYSPRPRRQQATVGRVGMRKHPVSLTQTQTLDREKLLVTTAGC